MFDEIKELIISTDDPKILRVALDGYHPYDIAEVFVTLDEFDKLKLIESYSAEEMAEILSYVEIKESSFIIEDLPSSKAAEILDVMEPDDASQIIGELDDEDKNSVISLLSEESKQEIEVLSLYEDETAGALMNTHFIKILEGTNLKQAIKIVTKMAPDVETIKTLFIVDKEDHLIGVLTLKDLICARMPLVVDDICLKNYAYVNTDADFDTLVKVVKNYDTMSLPVLEDGKIKGIITMDDAFDALTKVKEEDYAKLAGLTEDEGKRETIFGSFKKRIPWLAILLVLDVFIAMIISKFDAVIEKITVLTFFQAAVLGLAGNCGTQGLAVSVRKLSDGLLTKSKDIFKHIFKEIFQGLCIGLILGVVSFVLVTITLYIMKETDIPPYMVAFTSSIAVCCAVVLANLAGAVLPIVFSKMHIDPAVASGPFITTLNDIVAVVTYFGIAMLLLSNYL